MTAAPGRLVDRPWYGWVAVASSFVVLTFGAGFGFYSLSTYAQAVTQDQPISLTQASLGSTLFMLMSGVGGLVVARLVERSVRLPLYVGTFVCAAALPLLGHAHQAWQLWLVYVVYGIGSAGLGVIPASTLVIRWFGHAPARPLAIATTGMSVGGAVVAPLVATVVSSVGLARAGLLMAAALLVVLLPLVTFTVRSPAKPRPAAEFPEELEELGDEHAVETVVEQAPEGSAPPNRRVLVFAVTCLAFGLLLLSQVAAVTHMLTLTSERGLDNGAVALSVLAFTSVAGRLIGIPVLPRIGLRTFTVANALLQGLAMVAIGLAHSELTLLLGTALLGATVGNTVVLLPLSVLDSFGLGPYPRMYARANLLTGLGVAAGPLLLGALHGVAGSYEVPLIVLGGGSAAAAALLAVVPRGSATPKTYGPVRQFSSRTSP